MCIRTRRLAMVGRRYFPGLGAENPGFAGEDLRLLIGQITTAGALSGSIYVQIFPWGVQDPDLRLLLPILYAPAQCMDETACNYDASAWSNDECEYRAFSGGDRGRSRYKFKCRNDGVVLLMQ